MFEQLDQFENDGNNRNAAFGDAPAQWELLKHNLSQLPSKRYDGRPFQWTDRPERMESFVRLGEVAAQLFDEGKRDVAKKGRYRIRFGRPPLGPNEVRLDELVEPEEWELMPGTLNDEFIWLRGEYRFLPETLAEAIAIKLTEVYDELKDAARL
jgi:hypothetical protein